MSKYIKLEDAIYGDCILIDEVECEDCPFYDEEHFLCRMVKWLESLPTINIVRCKDCKWYEKEWCYCGLHNNADKDIQPTDYCSYGEKKDNE